MRMVPDRPAFDKCGRFGRPCAILARTREIAAGERSKKCSAMRLTDGLIQFDTLYRDGEAAPRVMAIAVHPFVTGQPHRIGALDAALEYICSHDGVWRATSWEIVRTTWSQ